MTTLTLDAMQTLHGAKFWRPPRGASCGFLVGAMLGAGFLFGPFSASLIFIFTPATCLLDYAL